MSFSAKYPPSSGGGSGTVTEVDTGTGLTGGPITTTGTISLADTAVTPGTYGSGTQVAQVTVDQQGRVTGAANVTITTATTAVTAVSVTSTNGLAGSSSGTTTPALTLSTTVTGIVKGNGTALSAATSGTDYAPGTSGNTTGIVKSTTGTGALTTAIAADFPILNQNTSGTAGSTGTVSTLTTLGDSIYGGVSGATTRLAGNTTAVKQYLSQTGTGSVSAAPAWATVAQADVTGLKTTDSPTFAGLTAPTHIGGTTASSTLTLQSTSGAGTTDAINLKVGNNGATSGISISTAGAVTVGPTAGTTHIMRAGPSFVIYNSSGADNPLVVRESLATGTARQMMRFQLGAATESSPGTSCGGVQATDATTAPAFYVGSSDARLKEGIEDAPTGALARLCSVRLRDFWIKGDVDRPKIRGVIAQELQEVYPDHVRTEADGFLGVSMGWDWEMIRALQELKSQLEAANVRIAALEAKG